MTEARWEPRPEDIALIDRLEVSDDELDKAYADAYKERCYIVEFGNDAGSGITAVGELDAVVRAEQTIGREIDVQTLTMADCIRLGASPGVGATRAERIRDGLSKVVAKRSAVPQSLENGSNS